LAIAVIYLACDLAFGWGLMLADIARRYPGLSLRPSLPDRAEARDILAKVKWLAVLQGAPVAWLHAPLIVLAQLGAGAGTIVGFVVARTLANFARQLGTMLSLSSGAEAAPALHLEDFAQAARHVVLVGIPLCSVTGALAAALLVFGPSVVTVWTGRTDVFDASVLAWLVVGISAASPAQPLASLMMLGDRPRPVAHAGLVQLAVGLTACAALTASFGVAGGAAGLAAGEVLGGLILLWRTAGVIGIDTSWYLVRCLIAMAGAGMWSLGIALALAAVIDPQSATGLALCGLVWGLLGLLPSAVIALLAAQRDARALTMGVARTARTSAGTGA
jgi:hypothetical protein